MKTGHANISGGVDIVDKILVFSSNVLGAGRPVKYTLPLK